MKRIFSFNLNLVSLSLRHYSSGTYVVEEVGNIGSLVGRCFVVQLADPSFEST